MRIKSEWKVSKDAFEKLKNDMKRNGLINPLIVSKPKKRKKYIIPDDQILIKPLQDLNLEELITEVKNHFENNH